jgi:hypothetical protein
MMVFWQRMGALILMKDESSHQPSATYEEVVTGERRPLVGASSL